MPAFYWLSHEELPVNTSGAEPIDRKLLYQRAAQEVWSIRVHDRDILFSLLLPGSLYGCVAAAVNL